MRERQADCAEYRKTNEKKGEGNHGKFCCAAMLFKEVNRAGFDRYVQLPAILGFNAKAFGLGAFARTFPD